MNQPASEEPNPTLIFDTLNAYQRTGALKAAIELKLFTAIGVGQTDATALAAACGAGERGVRILCDYLTVIGLLNKSSVEYSLTSTAAAFLDDTCGVCADDADQYRSWRRLYICRLSGYV